METHSHTSPRPVTSRDGWGWFVVSLLSRVYLFVLLTLAAIAILPALCGWGSSVVQSGSMKPHIDPGDVVLTSELSNDSPVPVGGVVTYRSPAAAEPSGAEKTRLHRIVAANDDSTFVTAGDANSAVDSTPITREQITGQARLLIPMVGLPGMWIERGNVVPFSLWVLITLGALFAAWFGMPRVNGDEATDDDEPHPQPVNLPAIHGGAGYAGAQTPLSTSEPVSRRTALGVSGTLIVMALAAVPREPAFAGFSGRTSTVQNSWTVAVLAPLTVGRAASYALFAGTSITHGDTLGIGTSIDASVATSPGTTVYGFWPWDVTGSTERNTASARNARTDLLALYSAANSRTTTSTRAAALSGTVPPGIYASQTGHFTVQRTMTLDARGDASAIFIFKARSLTAVENSTITLINGASAANVYWCIETTVTLGASSVSRGNYLARGNIAMNRGGTLTGRLVSFDGGVTVTRATISLP